MEDSMLLGSGTYNLKLDKEKSVLEIELNGLYTGKEKEKFENELGEFLRNINHEESTLIVNCNSNIVFSAGILPVLEETMKKLAALKMTYILNAVNCIGKIQFEKVIDTLGISHKFKYVESKDEINK